MYIYEYYLKFCSMEITTITQRLGSACSMIMSKICLQKLNYHSAEFKKQTHTLTPASLFFSVCSFSYSSLLEFIITKLRKKA